jgi:uncharacterized protein
MAPSAAATVRDARASAGLTQVELARRAGVTQSVISAYESGHRQPSLRMLTDLVFAAGFELRIELASPTERLTGPVGRRIRQQAAAIRAVVAEHGATRVRVFGSVARGEDREDSDVDLLVDLADDTSLFELGRMSEALEALLGSRVDVVPSDGVKADVRARIDRDLITL